MTNTQCYGEYLAHLAGECGNEDYDTFYVVRNEDTGVELEYEDEKLARDSYRLGVIAGEETTLIHRVSYYDWIRDEDGNREKQVYETDDKILISNF